MSPAGGSSAPGGEPRRAAAAGAGPRPWRDAARRALSGPDALALVLVAAFFVLNTTPIRDGDYFWHVATGRWIVEHRALPDVDPFADGCGNEAAAAARPGRVAVVLKQYWLGQVAMYGLDSLAGPAGMVVLRAATYAAVLLLLYWWMRRRGAGFVALVPVFLLGSLLRRFPNERPQLFTLAFTALALWLLEALRRAGPRTPRMLGTALVLLLLAWANVHAGFILGVGLVALYLAGELLPGLRTSGRPRWGRITILAGAAAVTLANPCTYHPAVEFLSTRSAYAGSILENLSPARAAIALGLWFPAYVAALALTLTTLAWRGRSLERLHVVVAVVLGGLSLSALRHMPFLLLAAPLLVAAWPEPRWRWRYAVVWVGVVAWLPLAGWAEVLQLRVDRRFPVDAVAFLAAAGPELRLFNHYDWGGYILARQPGARVFVDGRALSEEASVTYDRVVDGVAWRAVFARDGINAVLMPGVARHTGATFALVRALVDDPEWRLVFADDVALVLLRATERNGPLIARHAQARESFARHVLGALERLEPRVAARPEFWLSRGEAHMRLGEVARARDDLERALRIDPRNEAVRLRLHLLAQGAPTPHPPAAPGSGTAH